MVSPESRWEGRSPVLGGLEEGEVVLEGEVNDPPLPVDQFCVDRGADPRGGRGSLGGRGGVWSPLPSDNHWGRSPAKLSYPGSYRTSTAR